MNISNIINDNKINLAKELINNNEKVTIIAHVSPDGDAIGSSLALYWYLLGQNKNVSVVVPNRHPEFLDWMPGADKIISAFDKEETALSLIAEAELIFFLDFNTLSRIKWIQQAASDAGACKIMIDHHPEPDIDCDVCISHTEISSTAELIFRFIYQMGELSKLTLESATCIYTGMMTDTGNFSYNSQRAEIYAIIYELVKIGIDKDDIYRKVHNVYSVDRMRLMGYCLSEKMQIFEKQKAALVVLSREDCEKYNFQKGDTEGFVNIPFSIKGIEISIFAREDSEKVKISFRSQGEFPANNMAKDFNGGGHRNAAGGESYKPLQTTIKLLEEAILHRNKYE